MGPHGRMAVTYATPRHQTTVHTRRRFEDALARSQRMYASGVDDLLWATATGWTRLDVPKGYPKGDTASWLLGACHQRRDTIHMRGGSAGPTQNPGVVRARRRKAKRDGTPDD